MRRRGSGLVFWSGEEEEEEEEKVDISEGRSSCHNSREANAV